MLCSGHLPAPVVNGGGDRPRKVQFWELQKPLDLGSGHTACCRPSVIDLYLHTKFHRNWKNCGRTDVPSDGRTFPPVTLLGRLGRVNLESEILVSSCTMTQAY